MNTKKDYSKREKFRPCEVNDIYGLSVKTLEKWMKEPDFPKPLRPSKRVVLIDKKEFEKWMEKRTK